MTVRTRFAPSPTGHLHLGNARTALLSWLVARHHGGSFLLRFEDTDVERGVAGAERTILESLDWLGLDRDEGPERGGPHGPYRQSERLALYRDFGARLLEDGAAYRCYCRPEELEARRQAALERGEQPVYDGRCRNLDSEEEAALRGHGPPASVRFRVDPGPVTFRDRVRGEVSIAGSDFGDFVILRSDGRPTYNFAVVVDDLLMEITHVIRGVGHLSNTPKQLLLYRALEASPPAFAHIPHVLGPGGTTLSKREGAPAVLDYRDRGFHPDAVLNHLSLLSWSSESGREVLSRVELVETVDLDRVGRADARVDPEKMRWLSGEHIRRESVDGLAARLADFVDPERYGMRPGDRRALAALVRDRIQLLTEARADAATVFPEPDLGGEEAHDALRTERAAEVLREVHRAWSGLEAERWDRETLDGALRRAGEAASAGGRALYHPLRAALTGSLQGPEVPRVARALGRERTLRRLERGLELARAAAPGNEAAGNTDDGTGRRDA